MAMSKLASADGRPGWADLPGDLLESVLGRLPVPDRLRFPAVCTAWQSAASTATAAWLIRIHTVPSPWLMLPFNPTAHSRARRSGSDGDARFLEEARFLSLADGRAYAIRQPAPAVIGRLCVGSSSDGWLVTADAESELQLLNPITGAQVQLPPVATLPFVDASRDADGRVVSCSVVSYNLRCCFTDDDEVVITDDGPWSHDRCHEVAPDVGVLDLADGSYRQPCGAVRDLLWKWPPGLGVPFARQLIDQSRGFMPLSISFRLDIIRRNSGSACRWPAASCVHRSAYGR